VAELLVIQLAGQQPHIPHESLTRVQVIALALEGGAQNDAGLGLQRSIVKICGQRESPLPRFDGHVGIANQSEIFVQAEKNPALSW